MVIVNTATSYVIKLYEKYVLFSVVLLVIGVIEHRGWCSAKGEGFVITLVKIHEKIYTRTWSWDTYSKLNGGKNILVGVHSVYYG